MVVGKVEVRGYLVRAVARLLRLELDEPQPVVPQHCVVGRTTSLGVVARRKLELVDEHRVVPGPHAIKDALVQGAEELRTGGGGLGA